MVMIGYACRTSYLFRLGFQTRARHRLPLRQPSGSAGTTVIIRSAALPPGGVTAPIAPVTHLANYYSLMAYGYYR